jgi:23S rRNA (adenine2030-N6)-methyltransferase
MNYLHDYHAGNFADVFKHVLLIGLITCLQEKEKPLFFLDTHAGRGCYDLRSCYADKTQEYVEGVASVMAARESLSVLPWLAQYFALLDAEGYPAHYPGSPLLFNALLRSQDRLLVCEKIERVCQDLKIQLGNRAWQGDGYHALKSHLPPIEKRGLIVIDPPYESPEEFEHILSGMRAAHKRFATGVYAIWYPLKSENAVQVQDFLAKLATLGACLDIRLLRYPVHSAFRALGCGMVILNAPWAFKQNLQQPLGALVQYLSPQGLGRFEIS